MGRKNSQYTPEFREMAAKEVVDRSRPIADVARELGVVEQTLGNWVKRLRDSHGDRADTELSVSERARLTELERENRALRLENEFLGKSAAFFAKRFR